MRSWWKWSEQTELVRGFLASTFREGAVTACVKSTDAATYAIIGELVEPKTRVLDLGCGEGELLAWLKENKNVDGRGVELTGARVQKAIARGVSVYQGDLESARRRLSRPAPSTT